MPARLAAMGGEVDIEVIVRSGEVVSTRLVSGDRALGEASKNNIKSWRFSSSNSATFVSHFAYQLYQKQTGEKGATRLELELPYSVKLTAPQIDW
jgi:hypothetical protein